MQSILNNFPENLKTRKALSFISFSLLRNFNYKFSKNKFLLIGSEKGKKLINHVSAAYSKYIK